MFRIIYYILNDSCINGLWFRGQVVSLLPLKTMCFEKLVVS